MFLGLHGRWILGPTLEGTTVCEPTALNRLLNPSRPGVSGRGQHSQSKMTYSFKNGIALSDQTFYITDREAGTPGSHDILETMLSDLKHLLTFPCHFIKF